MNLPMIFVMMLESNRLILGQVAGESSVPEMTMQQVVEANAKNISACKKFSAEVEFEYFGLKETIKTSTKYFSDHGKERWELKGSNGMEAQRVVASGLTHRFYNPGKRKPSEGQPRLGGKIYRSPPTEEDRGNGDAYTPTFCHFTVPWNDFFQEGVSLQHAVGAKDTEVRFVIKKRPDGGSFPVILLVNKEENNQNINGMGEYNATGYNEEDNGPHRYNLEIWFSPEHNFAISKMISTSVQTKETFWVRTVDQFREIKKGVFVPQSYTVQTADTKKKALVVCGKAKLTKASIDEPIPDSVFTLKFPENVPVLDYTIYKVWYANKEGKVGRYLKNSRAYLVAGFDTYDPLTNLTMSLVDGIKSSNDFAVSMFDWIFSLADDPLSFLLPGQGI